jgi:shikimate kinase
VLTIVFVGMPGSGKSTVGQKLARSLRAGFFDSDSWLEQRFGCSVPAYFAEHGELAFRQQESLALQALVQGEAANANSDAAASERPAMQVVSTGGGAMMSEANRDWVRSRAKVIYLHATPEQLVKRVRADGSRPLLAGDDVLGRLDSLYAVRHPQFLSVAHHRLDTGDRFVGDVAAEALAWCNNQAGS